MSAVWFVLVAIALWCGWTCGRYHERYNHNIGSVVGFRGRKSERGDVHREATK